MTQADDISSNPFHDSGEVQDIATTSTLVLGRDVSLALGTDTLIVLDEGLSQQRTYRYCGLIPSKKSGPTRAIPLYNILWAELSDFEINIHYAHTVSKDVVRPACITYSVEKTDRNEASRWVEQLLEKSYGTCQRKKRIKMLINPFAGRGGAQKWYGRDIEPIFAAARCDIDVEKTSYSGHAREIAETIDTDAYDVIASCSGDGLPHEVFNGLAKKKDASKALASVAVVQLPCGTGNAMSLNLNGTDSPSLAALAIVKGIRTPLDLVSITQGNERYLSFLSQSVGIVAETDLGTENLRWMGSARFTYGLLVRLLGKTVYPADIAVKVVDGDKASIKSHYRSHQSPDPSPPETQGLPPLQYGTVRDPLPDDWQLAPYPTLGNFYCGNMSYMAPDTNFFQAAQPADGCADLICIDGTIPRLASIKLMLAVGNGSLFDMPLVSYRKVAGYRIVPHSRPGGEGYISIDGERVPFEPFQVEVHPGLGMVLSRSGSRYETAGL